MTREDTLSRRVELEEPLSRATSVDEVLQILECKRPSESELFERMGVQKPTISVGDFLVDEGIADRYTLHLFDCEYHPELGVIEGTVPPNGGVDYRLALIKKGLERYLEIAVLGFKISPKDTFSISQIQGTAQNKWIGFDEGYETLPFNVAEALPKDWPGILVRSAKRLAKDIGCSTITIIRAQNHPDYVFPNHGWNTSKDLQNLQERLKARYNGTARRNGFKKQEELYSCKL